MERVCRNINRFQFVNQNLTWISQNYLAQDEVSQPRPLQEQGGVGCCDTPAARRIHLLVQRRAHARAASVSRVLHVVFLKTGFYCSGCDVKQHAVCFISV